MARPVKNLAVLAGLLLSNVAFSQDTAPEPLAVPAEPAEVADPGNVLEVTVYGEAAIRDARARVIRAFESEGWRGKDRRGKVIFRGPKLWMGRGHLDNESGAFTFSQPVITVAGLVAKSTESVGPDLATERSPSSPTFAIQFNAPSHQKVVSKQDTVFSGVRDSLQAYNRVIVATRFRERLEVLPDRLDSLWREGVPLEPGDILPTPESRRAAVLSFWASRSDTKEGDAMTHAVELWIAATVQTSDTPMTAAEADAAEAQRTDGRRLPR